MKALINKETRVCENVIVEGANWTCPDIYEMVDPIENAGIGWSYINGVWIDPNPPVEESEETL
jgi:hypothetical protein